MSLTNAGLETLTYEERRAALVSTFAGLAGANVATDEGTVEGDQITLFTLGAQELAELLEAVHNAAYVRSASGAALDRAASWYVGNRFAEAYSTVTLPMAGTADETISAGVLVRAAGADTLWALDDDVDLDGDGEGEGTFTALTVGPFAAQAGTTWGIVTPVVNLDTVGPNTADAVEGNLVESDEAYRLRARQALDSGSVEAAVLKVQGVTLIRLAENYSDTPDAFWSETKWFEILVVGGSDEAIAAAIHANRPPGIRPIGNTSVMVTAANYLPGGEVEIKFSRATEVEVWLAVEITKGEGFPSATGADAVAARAALIKAAILAWGAARLQPDTDVSPFQVAASCATTLAGVDSISVLVGTADPPVSSAVLEIDDREIAVLDEDRITVTEV